MEVVEKFYCRKRQQILVTFRMKMTFMKRPHYISGPPVCCPKRGLTTWRRAPGVQALPFGLYLSAPFPGIGRLSSPMLAALA
jgi:hypothetical protein